MTTTPYIPDAAATDPTRACWFVAGADRLAHFLAERVWENPHDDKFLDQVRAVRPGDRIALRSTATRKGGVPFDNHGNPVSVMTITAVGRVTANPGDGRHLAVDWTPVEPPRDWFFLTNFGTIVRVGPGPLNDELIAFTFEGRSQDLDLFRRHPFWRQRFGDDDLRYAWTAFYAEFADRLLEWRDRRGELVAAVHAVAGRAKAMGNLTDRYPDGHTGPLEDICPFTTMGLFNRPLTDTHRQTIARELGAALGVTAAVPDAFWGIPVLNPLNSWFFGFAADRHPGDIDALWEVFGRALAYADARDDEAARALVPAYDAAAQVVGVKWNLTMGLYWARPWAFPTLDGQSREYLKWRLKIPVKARADHLIAAADYLDLADKLAARFQEDSFPVHSFPDLSEAAWRYRPPEGSKAGADSPAGEPDGGPAGEGPVEGPAEEAAARPDPAPVTPYSLGDIVADGCFLGLGRLQEIQDQWRATRNLILQGPPGTGKTWLARRLAYALIGRRDDGGHVRAVQFHPNLSYEDFVRGWRPAGDGRLALADGPFLSLVRAATEDPQTPYVMVIEEINRGNPAQVFGEMLTLMEADKRTPEEALAPSYPREPGETVYIPGNLYVIGTMNVADRSLALVDFALRRRFAFADLEPEIGEAWQAWVAENCGLPVDFLRQVQGRLAELNAAIAADHGLGRQFRIGHSFVTPPRRHRIDDPVAWFRGVVASQIGPLLDEYWFDQPDRARAAADELVRDLRA
jgi:5-methylcytosine-specific restriction protein B